MNRSGADQLCCIAYIKLCAAADAAAAADSQPIDESRQK